MEGLQLFTVILSFIAVSCATQEFRNVNPESDVEKEAHKHTSFIGFTAYKTSTQAVTAGDRVIFDGVLLNEGGFYQPALSRFTCPVDGVYFISVNVQTVDFIELDVIKDEEQMIDLYNGFGFMPQNIISNAGVIRCLSGEIISVLVRASTSTSSVVGEPGVPKTTFTVMLMSNSEGSEADYHQDFVGLSIRKTSFQSLEPDDMVIFDDVWYDPGNNYLPSLNRFVCPQTGIYYTYFTAWKFVDENVYIGLEKNGIMELLVEDSQEPGNNNNMLSNSYVSRCEAGEWMSISAIEAGYVGADINRRISTFSSMLIQGTGEDIISAKHTSFVGFSAFKTSDQFYNISDTINFQGVMINEGSHYSALLSRFTCPTTGIYYVAVTLVKLDTNPLLIELRSDTIGFLRLEETEIENPYNTVSNNVLLRCSQGQTISVKATGSGAVHGDTIKALTTLTVMQMSSD